MANNILKGIKVVELGTHVAIPYCARELSDMGADVIKIEPPRGESYRMKMSMLFQLPMKPGSDTVFTPYNTNKKSLCLNLKDEDSREALLKLLADTDIFLTNTREMALEKLGLSLESLRERFPRLIIGSVNGFGTKGPDKDRPGYDATSFWSASGALQEWTYSGEKLLKPFYGYGDSIASAQLTSGVMAAMYEREKTGKGDIIRVSLLGAGLWHNICGLLRYQTGHQFPKDYHDSIIPVDNFFKTKDGKWLLTSEENWEGRCYAYFDLFGTPELNDDPNWNSLRGFLTNIPEKAKFFEEHFAQVTSEEISAALAPAGCVFSFADETTDVLGNEQAWENDFLTKMNTADGTELIISRLPFTFESQGTVDSYAPAPQLGQDTKAILSGLGYSEEEIKALVEKKAVVAYEG